MKEGTSKIELVVDPRLIIYCCVAWGEEKEAMMGNYMKYTSTMNPWGGSG